MKTFSPEEFKSILKAFINQSYKDELDNILTWKIAGEEIKGSFKDNGKKFQFKLSKSGIEYQPLSSNPSQKLDSVTTKPKNCQSQTSYSCGDSCISNNKICRIGGSQGFSEQGAIQVISIAKRVSADLPAASGPFNEQQPFGSMGTGGAIQHGAAQVNTSIPIYSKLRANYRNNFERSAQMAIDKASQIKVPDIDDAKTGIIIATGGFSGDAKGGKRLKTAFRKLGLKEQHVVPISNAEFDIDPKDKLPTKQGFKNAFGKMISTVLDKGYNPVSVDIAANTYAYSKKYPSKTVTLAGHSAGGIASHEAAEILEKYLNIKPKVIAIGTPYFGLTEPTSKSVTIASKKDLITRYNPVMNPQWIDVDGHNIEQYFGNKESRNAIRSFIRSEEKKDSLVSEEKFISLLKLFLEAGYTDGIDQFIQVDVTPNGDTSGTFIDGTKLLDFEIKNNKVVYYTSKNRNDAWLAGFVEAEATYNEDSNNKSKPKNCKIGISCGDACIARDKTCDYNLTSVASPQAIAQLKHLALAARNPVSAALVPPTPQPQPDKYDNMTIRELKREAQYRGVYRYSDLNSENLRKTLRQIDNPPAEQAAVAKTLEEQSKTTKTLRKFGISGKSKGILTVTGKKANPEKALAQSVQKWNRLIKIMKLSGIDPGLAAAAVTAVITGISIQQYNRMRDNYRLGLVRSTKSAEERASKIQATATPRGNITFAVGGFSAEGSTARKLAEELENYANAPGATNDDRWFNDSHFILPFESREFKIGQIKQKKYNRDGTYNPLYLAELSNKSFNAYLRNFRRGRNDDAVELAAQLYSYANYRDPTTGKYMNETKPINVIAHATGGNTVHEAMDILARMTSPRAKPGREVASKINIVTMGTTDFGFAERSNNLRERNITSSQDPFSFLPQRNEKWISDVKGHEIEDYMRNELVKDQILQAFGRYNRTAYQYELQNPRRPA